MKTTVDIPEKTLREAMKFSKAKTKREAILAAVVVFSGVAAPLALVGAGFETAAIIVGGLAFAIVAFVLYRWVLRMGARSTATT